jgi:serine/threonine protein phosphatase Stp1
MRRRIEQGAQMRFECVSRTHVGLRRKINEDSVLADPERSLWVVADGMGGHDAGEIASTMVTDALRCLPETADIDQLTGQAVESLREVNRDLIALAQSQERDTKSTIGTTVVGLAIADGSFRCFWMGDSRAYRIHDGEIARLTHDHSLVQELVDAGMLREEDADTHEQANLITRAVGTDANAEVEVVSGDAQPGDRFLLASDGLTRVVADHELRAAIANGSTAEAADNLLDIVLERGAPDNVSLIIVKLL